MEESTRTEASRDAAYERRDLDPRTIAIFGVALAAVIVVVGGVAFWMVHHQTVRYASQQPPPSPLALTREAPPEPRLQVNGAEELREMRKAEDATLRSYAWIDREAGTVRIPIERAMEMLAEKGGSQKQGGRP